MYFLGVWVWQRLTLLIKTLVRFLSVLTKKQSWAFSSILVESSLSKNPSKSIQLKPPTLVFDQIWTWYLIKFLILCPGLPSARVQLSPSSNPPFPWCFLSHFPSSHPPRCSLVIIPHLSLLESELSPISRYKTPLPCSLYLSWYSSHFPWIKSSIRSFTNAMSVFFSLTGCTGIRTQIGMPKMCAFHCI